MILLARIAAITERTWLIAFRRLLSVRVVVGWLAIGQGFFRLPLDLPIVAIVYGGNNLFGALLLTGGLALLITTRWRLSVCGRSAALFLAVIYAAFLVAIAPATASGAWIAFVAVLALLAEAGAYD